MSEGVVLFVITVIVGIPLSVAIGLFLNDLQQRRDFGAFSVRKKSPARILQEYEQAKRLRDDPRLLGLNVATWLLLSVETLIVYAIFILIGIFFIVFLNAYADVAPLNNLSFRTVAVTLIGLPLIPILAKAVLDLKDLRSRRDELMRLIFFEDYETAVSPLLGTAEAAAGSQAAPRSGAKNRTAKPRHGKRA